MILTNFGLAMVNIGSTLVGRRAGLSEDRDGVGDGVSGGRGCLDGQASWVCLLNFLCTFLIFD
jgi:hypothetical protein